MSNRKGSINTTFFKKILVHILNEIKRNSVQKPDSIVV